MPLRLEISLDQRTGAVDIAKLLLVLSGSPRVFLQRMSGRQQDERTLREENVVSVEKAPSGSECRTFLYQLRAPVAASSSGGCSCPRTEMHARTRVCTAAADTPQYKSASMPLIHRRGNQRAHRGCEQCPSRRCSRRHCRTG